MPFPNIQSAFRQILNANASQCSVAGGITLGEATMAEPLAVCLHATRRAGNLVGKSVLVTGCGPIGILSILCVRRAGADLILATDLSDFTLQMAQTWGADKVINMARNPDGLSEFTPNKGTFDVLYECTGAALTLTAGIEAMRSGGTIMRLELSGDVTLPTIAITAKQLSLKGSFRFHDKFLTGVSLMQTGLINVKPLITRNVSIKDAVAGFKLAPDPTQAGDESTD